MLFSLNWLNIKCFWFCFLKLVHFGSCNSKHSGGYQIRKKSLKDHEKPHNYFKKVSNCTFFIIFYIIARLVQTNWSLLQYFLNLHGMSLSRLHELRKTMEDPSPKNLLHFCNTVVKELCFWVLQSLEEMMQQFSLNNTTHSKQNKSLAKLSKLLGGLNIQCNQGGATMHHFKAGNHKELQTKLFC